MPSVTDPSQAARLITAEFRQRALAPAMGRYIKIQSDVLRKMISVPVERSGGKVIRSKPREAPRRDKGKYIATVTDSVEQRDNVVRASTGVTSPIGPYLEEGTARMAARPHHQRLRDQILRNAAQDIAAQLFNSA